LNRILRNFDYFDAISAENFLRSIKQVSSLLGFDLLDERQHESLAETLASQFRFLTVSISYTKAKRYGFDLSHYNETEIKTRVRDMRFWKSQIRKRSKELLSELERCIGLVSNRRAKYCGDLTYGRFRESEQKSNEFLERHFIQSLDGERVSLKEISEHNTTNKQILFYEWITRVKGFDELAERYGHASMMVTLTCPAYMHATYSRSGSLNQKYDGQTVRECQRHLNTVWRRVRAKLKRDNVNIYGMRVVEPHHDGTPHWHLIVHCEEPELKQVKRIIKHYALQESPNECGALERRVDFIDIDRAKGSSASYLAKYLAKNMIGLDTEGEGCRRVSRHATDCARAWASAHSIRQFQQFGGASVTVYRELRRLRDETLDPIIEPARLAADASNWATYCEAVGGVSVSSRTQTIKPYYEQSESFNRSTGEIIEAGQSENVNRYGEPKSKVVKGLAYAGKVRKTRTKLWTIIASPPQSDASPPARAACRGNGGHLGLV